MLLVASLASTAVTTAAAASAAATASATAHATGGGSDDSLILMDESRSEAGDADSCPCSPETEKCCPFLVCCKIDAPEQPVLPEPPPSLSAFE